MGAQMVDPLHAHRQGLTSLYGFISGFVGGVGAVGAAVAAGVIDVVAEVDVLGFLGV